MTWLWTDTLAALLFEHDGVPFATLVDWVERPVGVRIQPPDDILSLARRLYSERRHPSIAIRQRAVH